MAASGAEMDKEQTLISLKEFQDNFKVPSKHTITP